MIFVFSLIDFASLYDQLLYSKLVLYIMFVVVTVHKI